VAKRGPGTIHAPKAAKGGQGDRPRPHGGQMGPSGLAITLQQPDGVQAKEHAPTAARRVLGASHAHTVPRRGSGDGPHPHGGQTGDRGQTKPPRHPDGAQETCHASTVAKRSPGDRSRPHNNQTMPRQPATPPELPDRVEGNGHAPTAARRCPGDRPRPHGNQMGPRGLATPHGSEMVQMKSATSPRRPDRAQKLATRIQRPDEAKGRGHTCTAARRVPGDGPQPHDGHTGPSGRATLQRRPDGGQGMGHTPTAARKGPGDRPPYYGALQCPGDRPHPQGGQTESRNWPRP